MHSVHLLLLGHRIQLFRQPNRTYLVDVRLVAPLVVHLDLVIHFEAVSFEFVDQFLAAAGFHLVVLLAGYSADLLAVVVSM